MEPIHWAIVFLILCTLVSFIASKKGRSGVKLFFAMALPAVPLMLLISYALGNNMEAKPLAMLLAAVRKRVNMAFSARFCQTRVCFVREYSVGSVTGRIAGQHVGIRTARRSRQCRCA